MLQGIPYPGPAHDIWSMGMILYQMVSNQAMTEVFSQTFTIINGTIHIHD
jgi:serine/threonine protein kinase